MTSKEISYIRCFLGLIEGVTITLPPEAKRVIFVHINCIDSILNREEKGGADNA